MSTVFWRMRGRSGMAAALLLAMTAVSPPSAAQPAGSGAPAPADPDGAKVKALYEQGVEAADKLQWQKAYDAFLAAWRVRRHPQVAANLGRAALKLGKHRDAAEYLAFFLREAKEVTGEERALAQKMLDESKQKVATLVLVVNRDGAELLVDGVGVGVSPVAYEVFVEPGQRVIEARRSGEPPAKVTVEVAAGSSRPVGLQLAEPSSASARPPEPRQVVVAAPDGARSARRGVNDALFGAGAATSLVALGAGVAFIVVANGIETNPELDSCFQKGAPPGDKQACNLENERRRDVVGFTNAAIGSFVGAGVFGAATLAYGLIVSRSGDDRATARVSALPVERGGGVMLTGQW